MRHGDSRRVRISFTRQELALVGATAIWGASFLFVHLAVQESGPWFFVGVRFLTAALVSAVIFHRSLLRIGGRNLLAGSAIGVSIYLGYGLQTVGMQTITPSVSSFITALYVPLVPLLQWLVLRKVPSKLTLAGVAVAFVGLIVLANPFAEGVSFGWGEAVTLIATVAIAGEIILISLFAGKVDLGAVTIVQLAVAGLLALATMPAVGEQVPGFSWVWLLCAVGLGVASCLVQLAMNWAQRSVSATKATLIYASEPVWGGIFGRLGGDRLPPLAFVGAGLIVAGVLISELRRAKPRDTGAAAEPPGDAGSEPTTASEGTETRPGVG